MTQNPFADASQKAASVRGDFSLSVAQVTEAPDDGGHIIAIKPTTKAGGQQTETSATPATVLVPQRGDVALPREGDLVVFSRLENRKPVVIGTLYSYLSSIREHDADERHIGADDGAGLFLHGDFATVPTRADDPSNPADGAVWYRTDLDEYRGVENGQTVAFDTTNV